MSLGKPIKIGIGLASSVLFVWLAFRALDFGQIVNTLSRVHAVSLLLAICAFAAGYLCRVARWQAILDSDGEQVPFRKAGIAFMVSIAANNVLPLRAGDVMRAFMFSGWLHRSPSAVLASLISERLLDLLFLLVALGAALYYLDLSSDMAGQLLGVGALGLLALGAFVALVLIFPHVFQPLIRVVLGKMQFLPGRIAHRLLDAVDTIFSNLKLTMRGGRAPKLLFLSALAWGFEGLVFYCTALSVPDFTNPVAAWLAMPVATLSTLLPSSPGYVGTFHYFVIQASEVLGNDAVAAAAFALLVHAVLWITATTIGGLCMALWSLQRQQYEVQ